MDGRWAVFSQEDYHGADIMVIDKAPASSRLFALLQSSVIPGEGARVYSRTAEDSRWMP